MSRTTDEELAELKALIERLRQEVVTLIELREFDRKRMRSQDKELLLLRYKLQSYVVPVIDGPMPTDEEA